MSIDNNILNNKICYIKKKSIAYELGIKKGDILLSINDQDIKDILDYRYNIADNYLILTIRKNDGEIWEYEIEKDYDEDMGIEFCNPLMDNQKCCQNRCIFCFVEQLPIGMRKSLYFKDDDFRLSFLHGNYITLTNLKEEEIDRIIKHRISPINISVHSTDPEIRTKMMNNKNAGKINNILKRFSSANIEMNCQVVLCPEVNDGDNLDKTLQDLSKLYPSVKNVAVVPVGLTKHRDGLYPIESYDYSSSNFLLEQIKNKQDYFKDKLGSSFVFASDEFYILAKQQFPKYEEYEGFPQIENGIGLCSKFKQEVIDALKDVKIEDTFNKTYDLITGVLATNFMKEICNIITNKIKGLNINVIPIKNKYFGEDITVAGLITGIDLLNQLKELKNNNTLIIPKVMLKNDENIFLDDINVKDIQEDLGINVLVSEINGYSFVNLFTNVER